MLQTVTEITVVSDTHRSSNNIRHGSKTVYFQQTVDRICEVEMERKQRQKEKNVKERLIKLDNQNE
jgi:hypothetical protein